MANRQAGSFRVATHRPWGRSWSSAETYMGDLMHRSFENAVDQQNRKIDRWVRMAGAAAAIGVAVVAVAVIRDQMWLYRKGARYGG